jgi:hypothetical protein
MIEKIPRTTPRIFPEANRTNAAVAHTIKLILKAMNRTVEFVLIALIALITRLMICPLFGEAVCLMCLVWRTCIYFATHKEIFAEILLRIFVWLLSPMRELYDITCKCPVFANLSRGSVTPAGLCFSAYSLWSDISTPFNNVFLYGFE